LSAVEHRFGPYGGQYVPETLMPALAELERGWEEAWADAAFRGELDGLLRDYAGRPTPLYETRRLGEAAGRRILLKREDLLHTGAHKLNNALGQALLAQRMGKRRVIAETGAGQHGVATATACALLGLECVVYMGTEDMRRQEPNVHRMGLLGAEVAPVEGGARTLKEAVSEAIRDWVAHVEDTHYVIGSSVGPAPYPAIVRDLQRVIGDEARAQVLEREGRLPSRVIACVGGGSNSIGIFVPFVDDAGVELVGVEAAGEGLVYIRLSTQQNRRPVQSAPGGFEVVRGDSSHVLIEYRGTRNFGPGRHVIAVRPVNAAQRDIARSDLAMQRNAPSLSPREREVLQLAARGHSTRKIAEILRLSPATVKTHFEHAYDKLGARDRVSAVAECLRRGLIE